MRKLRHRGTSQAEATQLGVAEPGLSSERLGPPQTTRPHQCPQCLAHIPLPSWLFFQTSAWLFQQHPSHLV